MNIACRNILCVFLLSLLTLVQAASADELRTVTVQGEALILEGDVPHARQRALQEAFNAAITQIMGSYINAESYTRNFQSIEHSVFSRTQGYVREYRILNETHDGELLALSAEVTVVGDAVLDDLTALGIVLDAIGNPVVRVDGHDEGLSESTSRKFFESLLTARGFQVVDQASAESADVIVRLEGRLRNRSQVGGLLGAVVELSASAYWQDSDRLITSGSMRANGAGMVEQDALKLAYERAAEGLFPDFLQGLLGQWQSEINSGRPIDVSVTSVDYQQLTRFSSRLSRVFGVGRVTTRRFSGNSADLVVTFTGTPDLLARLIGMTDFEDLAVDITALDMGGLSLRLGNR